MDYSERCVVYGCELLTGHSFHVQESGVSDMMKFFHHMLLHSLNALSFITTLPITNVYGWMPVTRLENIA